MSAAAEAQTLGRHCVSLPFEYNLVESSVMKKSVESLLDSFDRLPDDDKREVAAEILKRSAALDLPPLEDEALIDAAEKIFLELEKQERRHG